MFYALPYLAGAVLAFTGQLTAWWAIAIMVVVVFLAFSLAAAQDDDEFGAPNKIEFGLICLPQLVLMYVGDALAHPWGGPVAALVWTVAIGGPLAARVNS